MVLSLVVINVGIFPYFLVFVLPEQVGTMRWTGPLSRHSYKISEYFVV
jgi:hypothetical protein